MKLKFLKAKYNLNIKIPKNFIDKLNETFNKNSKIAIYSAVQFKEIVPEIKDIIKKEGYKITTSKADRTYIEGQILGCDSYKESLNLDLNNIEGFIYIGDGYFHPNALLLSQEFEEKIKPVLIVNIVQGIVEVIGREHIKKYLKKRKGNLLKFQLSKEIGVFVSTKWGQEYKESALKLKEKYKDKNFYFFIGDNFLDNEIENFPFIECWVNTACPRIGQDDILRHKKPVINIKDIF